MRHTLTDSEIDDLLQRQLYGHLGCTLPDGRPYVVPITFVYHGKAVYGFSYDGRKTEAMRANPSVCFQTEEFVSEGVWRSAIVWGTYEELSGKEHLEAARALFRRLDREQGTAVSPLYQPPSRALVPAASRAAEDKDMIFFRIRAKEKSGMRVEYD